MGVDTGSWWDDNVAANIEQFEEWVGGKGARSKIVVQKYVHRMGYMSFLDCGAGPCTDWKVYEEMGTEYRAIDSSTVLVEQGVERGIPIQQAFINDLPFGDSQYEIVHARHVLEHLNDYREAIREMLRVAIKEVIIVWFLPPSACETRRRAPDGLMHNQYMQSEVEHYLSELPDASIWRWEWVNTDDPKMLDECLLVITKRGSSS